MYEDQLLTLGLTEDQLPHVLYLLEKARRLGEMTGRLDGYKEGVEAAKSTLGKLNSVPSLEAQQETALYPLRTPIGVIGFTSRVYNCLMGEDLHDIRAVLQLSEQDLRCIRNMGASGLSDIRTKLAEVGYTLKTD